MKRTDLLSLVFLSFLLVFTINSEAADVIMNDNGFLYTTGSFPVSIPGDIFAGVGFISSTNPALNIDLTMNEMTWSLTGLEVTEQFSVGTRMYTNFSGGTVMLVVDPTMNAEYGIDPPNASVPSTFEDGEVFLKGIVNFAFMNYDTDRQYGALIALVNFTNGQGMTEIGEPNGTIIEYTFGPDDPNIPSGFNLQAIGSISVPALCTVRGNVNYTFEPETCEKCTGISRLELDYTGSGDLTTVQVSGGVETMVTGNHLVLTPGIDETELPGNTNIWIGCTETNIHTSCSRPIEPGNDIGLFTVTAVEKIIEPCEGTVCNGIRRLVLRYLGHKDPNEIQVSDGAYAVVDGDLITILPVGEQLNSNISVQISNHKAFIHTSCSQPIEPGFIYGEYEVVEVDKILDGGTPDVVTSGPVVGATVDLLDGEGNTHTTMTDELGDYIFFDVPIEDISVSVVVPLGFYPVTPTEVDIVCQAGDEAVVDFTFERLATQDKPRSPGFWKHQVIRALTGKQKNVQVPADELLAYFEDVHTRFDKYFDVFVPVITLEDLHSVLLGKQPSMYDKAKRQFAAIVLNTVSNRLATWEFVSEDEATVSQAITYVSELLQTDSADNHELAKYICEEIIRGNTIPADIIPLDIAYIAYRLKDGNVLPGVISKAGNFPNPFNPMTTIAYELKEAQPVNLVIYNVAGQRIKRLVSNTVQTGFNTVQWDGRDENGSSVSSGVYFYRLMAGTDVVTKRMVLLR